MIHTKQVGFTLIELIMVIVILGILSISVMPKFAEKSTFSERAFFSDTLNALRYAQKLATATGCPVRFSVSANQYSLMRRGTADSTSCPSTGNAYSLPVPHPSSGANSYSGSEPDITLSSIPSPFYFYPIGSVYSSGNLTADELPSATATNVTLRINDSKLIQVIGSTGFVYEQ